MKNLALAVSHDLEPGDRIVCRIEGQARVCKFSSWGVTGYHDSVAVIVPRGQHDKNDDYLMLVQAEDVLTEEDLSNAE